MQPSAPAAYQDAQSMPRSFPVVATLLMAALTIRPHATLACVVNTCTEAALDACLPGGRSFDGSVTFSCGGAATVTVSSTKSINADTTIDGGGLITISGGHTVRVFSNLGYTFTVENLSIANGSGGSGSGFYGGGAIRNDSGGTLTVTNSAFFSNNAPAGAAIANVSGGTLTVNDSTFTDNSAISSRSAASGGAIFNEGQATVTNTTFSRNGAVLGGAITSDHGTLTVTSCAFSGNSVTSSDFIAGGGAIFNNTFSTMTVANCTFFGNSEVSFFFPSAGGAIYSHGALTVTNCTFAGNSANAQGGGAIFNDSQATIRNSILALSGPGGNCFGSIIDGGHNIDDATTCGFTGPGCATPTGTSFCNTNSNLDPAGLANNGGPTQSIALDGGSSAINAGDEIVCGAAPVNSLDQRGATRPGIGATNCSIGAYEFNTPVPPGRVVSSSIVPDNGGSAGSVSVRLYGNEFAPGAILKLSHSGLPDIVATSVNVVTGGTLLTATFDLRKQNPGVRDVSVINPDGSSATLSHGFTVLEGGAPNLWVNILAPNSMRPTIPATFNVAYGNKGTIDANLVPLWISFDSSLSFTLLTKLTPPPLPSGSPLIDFSQVPISVTIGDRTFVPLLLPIVGPENTGVVRIQLTAPTAGQSVNIGAFVTPPLSFSAASPAGRATIALGDVPAGAPSSDVIDCGATDTQFILGIVVSCTPVGCGVATAELLLDVVSVVDAILKDSDLTTVLSFTQFGRDFVLTSAKCLLDVTVVGDIEQCIVSGALSDIGSIPSLSGCFQPTSTATKRVSVVTSVDPNGKAGPPGFGQEQWISGAQPLSYEVFFANEPTATVPAQTVKLTDQLDPTRVDLNSFALGPIAFGSHVVTPPPGQNAFNHDVDLRPDQNLIVRIAAELDTAAGLATWTYTSIDPGIGQPPTDPSVGFLPPDETPPNGEGYVLYTVNPRAGLATAAQITNQATVVFDANQPITTTPWMNTIDNTPPQSQITAASPAGCPTTFSVQWSGTDVGSGIQDFTIFTSEDGGPFASWNVNTVSTSDTFTGQCGKSYGFYSIARDNVGNVEPSPAGVQATVTVPSNGCVAHDFAVTNIATPKTAKLAAGVTKTVHVKVRLQNRSAVSETIPDAATLQNLIALNLMPAGGACDPPPVLQAGTLKLPRTLKPKQTFTVPFNVTLACVLQGLGHIDYTPTATVAHLALGCGDSYPDDDTCPRPALGVVPFPDGTVQDKGCAERLLAVRCHRGTVADLGQRRCPLPSESRPPGGDSDNSRP